MATRASFALETKDLSPDGMFVGLASVYGNVDLGGDVVERGAFTKSISERGAQVPILWQHDPSTPIGLGTLTDSPAGLMITGKLSLGTVKGREAYELLKDRVVSGLSIGYETVKSKRVGNARHLTELKLYEVSCVTFPMNPDAQISGVKEGRRHSGATVEKMGEARDHARKAADVLEALLESDASDNQDREDIQDGEASRKALARNIAQLKRAIAAPRLSPEPSASEILRRMRWNGRKLAALVEAGR